MVSLISNYPYSVFTMLQEMTSKIRRFKTILCATRQKHLCPSVMFLWRRLMMHRFLVVRLWSLMVNNNHMLCIVG